MVKPVTENKAIWDGIEKKPTLAENIEVVYEAEWKLSVLDRNLGRDPVGPRSERIRNIKDRIKSNARPAIEWVAEELERVFSNWLANHALDDPETWTEMRLDPLIMEDLNRAYDKPIHESLGILEQLGGGGGPMGRTVVSLSPWEIIEDWIRENGVSKRLKSAILEEVGHLEEAGRDDRAEKLLEAMREEDAGEIFTFFFDARLDTMTTETVINLLGAGYMDFFREVTKEYVFPQYVEYWKSRGLDQTAETIDDIAEDLSNVKPSNIKDAFVTINRALGASHQSGSMLQKIRRQGHHNVTADLLDELSSGPRQEWIEDIRKANLEVPDGMLEKCKKFLKGEITTESFIQVLESSVGIFR